jgi:hypothetical protein
VLVLDRNPAGTTCFNLPDPATCCPTGFTHVGYKFNDSVCLEDVASGQVALSLEHDVGYVECATRPDPEACCPAGFTFVGSGPDSDPVCVGL